MAPLSTKSILLGTETYDLTAYYDNVDKFFAEADEILTTLTFKNLGISQRNEKLRNQVLELQKNLLKCIADQNAAMQRMTAFDALRELLHNGKLDEAFEVTRQICFESNTSPAQMVETLINQMLLRCNANSEFSFDQLRSNRLVHAKPVDATVVVDLPEIRSAGVFECPISFETDDHPTLYFRETESALADVSKAYQDALITNPFMLLDDDALVAKVTGMLDHVVGYNTTKELYAHAKKKGNVLSPYSNQPIACVLTQFTGPVFHQANNYVLARCFFGDKLVGQPEVWLCVLYQIITRVQRIAHNIEFMSMFTKYLVRRLKSGTTNITLSGLAIEPVIKAPIDIALWYTISSPHVITNLSETIEDARNRLRALGASAWHVLKMVDLLHYSYHPQTRHQVELYQSFAQMMAQEKIYPPNQWRNVIRAQFQNSVTLRDGTIIMLDGPAEVTSRPPLPYIVSAEHCVALMKLVDASHTVNNVRIPWDLQAQTLQHKVNYKYDSNMTDELAFRTVKMCPATFRAYYYDRECKQVWEKSFQKLYGMTSGRSLSVDNYFLKMVCEMSQYPSQNELIKYMAMRQANKQQSKCDTLPTQVVNFVKGTFASYEVVLGKGFANVTPVTFKATVMASLTRAERVKLDDSDKLMGKFSFYSYF